MGLEELTGRVLGLASEGVPNNLTLSDLPPDIISRITGLVGILQAAGIIFIIYIAILIVRAILNFKKYKKIKRIDNKVRDIDEKLDLLLHEKTEDMKAAATKTKKKNTKRKKRK